MSRKTILTCAIVGSFTTRDHNPNVPITPEEIANSAIEAHGAGAAIVHIHVRDPETGANSMDLQHYEEVVGRIRDSGCGVILNLTTGPGGRFAISEDDPMKPGPGTNMQTPEKRVEHVVALQPEICSLDLNTMWFGNSAVINAPVNVGKMAAAIYDAGVKPELEIFDTGDIAMAKDLLKEGVLQQPALFQIVTGVNYGAAATPETLAYMRALLPPNATWAAFGVGRFAYPMLAQAWLLGGHCRIGLEDTAYLAKGKLTPSNGALVQKAKALIEDLGGELATAPEARDILELPGA